MGRFLYAILPFSSARSSLRITPFSDREGGVIVPFWFLALWAVSTFTYAVLASSVVKDKLFTRWPSLFFIGLDRVVFFIVGRALEHNYPLYFKAYWYNSALAACLDIWLAWDVWRSIPSVRWFPKRIRYGTWLLGAAVASLFASHTIPSSVSPIVIFVTRVNRSMQYTLGLSAVMMLLYLMISGIGFSLTGFRIMSAALVRQATAMFTAFVISNPSVISSYLLTTPVPKTVVRVTNAADTFISLCVAVALTFAIKADAVAQQKRREAWEAHGTNLQGVLNAGL